MWDLWFSRIWPQPATPAPIPHQTPGGPHHPTTQQFFVHPQLYALASYKAISQLSLAKLVASSLIPMYLKELLSYLSKLAVHLTTQTSQILLHSALSYSQVFICLLVHLQNKLMENKNWILFVNIFPTAACHITELSKCCLSECMREKQVLLKECNQRKKVWN